MMEQLKEAISDTLDKITKNAEPMFEAPLIFLVLTHPVEGKHVLKAILLCLALEDFDLNEAENNIMKYEKEKFKESIFLHDFGIFPQEWVDEKVQEKWNFLKKIRSEVNNAIELKRNEKLVGSGLDTNVHISLDDKYLFNFDKIDLPELFI